MRNVSQSHAELRDALAKRYDRAPRYLPLWLVGVVLAAAVFAGLMGR